MRDDELRRLLSDANPWWAAAAAGRDPTAWQEGNRTLLERSRHDLGHRSGVLRDIASEPLDGSLVILTGPRRAGKTVALLEAAATLCGRADLDPRQVIHVPCDGLAARELRRVFSLARSLTRSVDLSGPRPRVWVFAEVSGISGWTAAFKAARDGTSFGDDTVVATGSRWVSQEDLQAHLLAGRAGWGERRRVRQLLPLNFREVLACTHPELTLPPRVHPARLQEPAGLPAPAMPALSEMALARAVDQLEEGRWLADDTIGYSRTDSGREIDFSPVPVPSPAGAAFTTPIESKWVDQGWRQEALVLEGRYGRGVMATKSILDLSHPSWAIPVPLLACLLG